MDMTRVRTATPDDAPGILALHVDSIRAFGPDAYDDTQVAAWAEKEGGADRYPIGESGHYLVVAEDTESDRSHSIVGYGHLVPQSDEVRAVYVRPDAARRGVGSAVLARLERYARNVARQRLELWASHNAVGFYERMGYRPVKEETVEKSYDGRDVSIPVLVMEKSLGE